MAGFDLQKLAMSFAVPDDFEPVACWALGYLATPRRSVSSSGKWSSPRENVSRLLKSYFSEWESPAF
jgi:hypothetical protein